MPSIPDPVISVDNGILKWTSPEGTGQVPLDSIICVVQPQTHQGQQSQPHRVIFLNKSSEDNLALEHLDIQSVPKELNKYQTTIPPHLNSPESPVSVEVIISTLSGTGTAHSIFSTLIKPFLDTLGIQYTPHLTNSASSITEISKSILLPRSQAGITQNVILLSGDGGLIDILDVFSRNSTSTENGTSRIAPTISLIPCGTGNAMASSIGLDSPPSVSTLSSLLKGTPHSLPTFRVKFSPGSRIVTDEGRGRQSISSGASPSPSADGSSSSLDSGSSTMYGAVVASWGLHAALVADSDTAEYRKFGSERFKMAANELLHPSDGSEIHRFMGDISIGLPGESSPEMQKISESEHMYVLTTLVPRLEKDFLISPSTQALSQSQGQGQGMRFLRFGPRSAEECMKLMMLAYSGGSHVHEEGVMYEEVNKVRIDFREENERWRRVCVDGKIVVVEGGGWIEIEINREESVLNVLA